MRAIWLLLVTLLAAAGTLDSSPSNLARDTSKKPEKPSHAKIFRAWLMRPWSPLMRFIVKTGLASAALAVFGIYEAHWLPGSFPDHLALITKSLTPDSSHWAEWWTAYATLGLCGIAIIAAFVARGQVMLTRKVQRSQTFLEVSQRWNNDQFRNTRIEIRDVYCPTKNPDAVKDYLLGLLHQSNKHNYWLCMEALNFFETVAVLRKQDALTFEVVSKVWGFVIWDYWAMMHTFVQYQRENATPYDPYFCKEFEELAILIARKHCWSAPDDPHGEKPGAGK
ncbi:hypothetical protein A5658_05065 [Mycobacterium sp. 1245111.1]|nr:hypothetical protein A5658_05065 [Mycobacterium sp. 1245111.1]